MCEAEIAVACKISDTVTVVKNCNSQLYPIKCRLVSVKLFKLLVNLPAAGDEHFVTAYGNQFTVVIRISV